MSTDDEKVQGYLMLLHALGTIEVRGARSRRRQKRIVRELLENFHRHSGP